MTPKGDCKQLLEIATPDMFRANAFRITGLPVDATTREITKHADMLKMMEELGQGKSAHTGAFALKTPPTVDQIRDAIQRLKDPEHRIIDEFFWFWPREFGKSASDPAIKALDGGDADTALEIWTSLETSPADGVVAMHNVAILWHLMALEWERHYAKAAEFTEEKKKETEKLWRGAFKRWEFLATDDHFWERVSARIKQLDDPRLTTGFARRMRATLPLALDKINAELAVRYAEGGRMDLAQMHVQFMRETNEGLDDVEKTAELVLTPARARLKQQIRRAEERASKAPSDGLNAVRELVSHAHGTLALFDLFFGKESEDRNELSDEIATLCNQLPIAYHKATGDDKGCIELLRAALPFATSIDLRQQIEKNIGTLTGNLTFKQLEPVFAILKALQESSELPSVRLSRFKTEAVPAITKVSAEFTGLQAHIELLDSGAIVLRAISLAAWNTHQDMGTATAANELAVKYARDTELRQRLTGDQKTLREMAAQHAAFQAAQQAQQKSSNQSGAGCLVILGIIGVLVLINSFGSKKSSSSSSSSYSPSSVATPSTYAGSSSNRPSSSTYTPSSRYTAPSTYTVPSSFDAGGTGTYRVPQSRTAELDRDRRAVETAKAEAERYSSQIESLASEIERDRAYLNRGSQFAVDDFNRKVNRYNALLEQQRARDRSVNQLVDDYSAKLRRYGR